ncbi:bifunctional proline dehydrogenase/L-glutamate gamma-semialdehyde dehydrogenase PutA [Gammaproteobacteria bacterium]|nr:bifunctional proline dehydrogenase/L-glutamate gamma-semialdehyde dehydrogenase PutA [Gammaproteobacteria bacterium]
MSFSSKDKFQDENEMAKILLSKSSFLQNPVITTNTELLIQLCRNNIKQRTKLDVFMNEYGLSNAEGIALMCLAESLMRIPDNATRDSLINEKLTSASWSEHLGRAESFLVNSATWGLEFSKKFLQASSSSSNFWLVSLSKKIGEASIREAVKIAMQILSKEFVCAQDIKELENSSWLKSHRCSFDMLGEASRNQFQSDAYFESYLEAINSIGHINSTHDLSNGISIKLSALYSKYDALHQREVKGFLLPRVRDLVIEAAAQDVPVTIDAEEQDRLSLSLSIIAELAMDPLIKDWPKLGLAVQAYGKRSLQVIDYLAQLVQQREKMHVRLVKGAYWDYEIKNAQVKGLNGYPVFTNKKLTDINYLVTAKQLIKTLNLEASFATHNAHTISAIASLAQDKMEQVEFQRLYGMGEALYSACEEVFDNFSQSSIYCPIGKHKELLPYLVRRLLENGANSSFINQYLSNEIPASDLSFNPAAAIQDLLDHKKLLNLPQPSEIYLSRKNSHGLDLSEPEFCESLSQDLIAFNKDRIQASALSSLKVNSLEEKDILSKCNQSNIGLVHFSDPADVASLSFQISLEWMNISLDHRALVLTEVANSIEADSLQFIYLLMHEAGKTIQDAHDEIREAVDFLRYYAQQSAALNSQSSLMGPTGEENILEYCPKGIAVCISPWNFPLAITLGQIAAALVTGNTVIAKASEETSLIAYKAISLFFDHGLPKDALHLLLGNGELGQAIISSQAIDIVVFTGSLKTAKSIHNNLSTKPGKIVPLLAETGGLNSMVVDSSALIERACDDIMRSAFNSAGQRCSALRLLLVHETIYGELISMLKGMMNELIIGNPMDLSVDMGPMITLDAALELYDYLDQSDAARLSIFQPKILSEYGKQWFPPTLIEINSIESLNEETFGPILHVMQFTEDTLDSNLAQIEAKGFGLTFGIHTRIDAKAIHASKLVSAGNTYINRDIIGAVVESQPFGGKNLSGTGFKAGGPNYLIQFIDERTISINTVAIGGNAELLNQANVD